MADVFISYARSTAREAQAIAEALRALGYNVWRDDELPAHRAYAEVIEERLKAAKAVVVIWSAEAAKSEWVRSEADRARADRKLVQLTLDGMALPMPFDQIQCADLSGWSGDTAAPGWRKVVSSIADLVGGAVPASAPGISSERAGISICVLPFANMSNDPEQEYFADGISEDIITDLSKVSALAVVARNTAFTFKGKPVDVPQVARQLKVTHVLEGSVRKSGNRVRITAQLIDGASGNHAWAERYDRDLGDIFALQDEISEAIVSALRLKLLPEEKQAIEDRGTSSPEAYDRVLRARALFSQSTEVATARAIELIREAVAIDPGFVGAWGMLAGMLVDYAIIVPQRRAAILKERDAVIERLATQFPDDPISFRMRAAQLLFRRDFLGADRMFQLAQAKLANRPAGAVITSGRRPGHGLGQEVGRFADNLATSRELVKHDPLSLLRSSIFQEVLDITGHREEAQAEYERSKDLVGQRTITETMALMRMSNEARPDEIKAQWARVAAGTGINGALARALAAEPDGYENRATARRVLHRFFDDPAWQNPTALVSLSLQAGFFGDTDLALAILRRTFIDMEGPLLRRLWHPVLAETRKDPRFKELVRDLGLYDYWKKSGHWSDFVRPLGDDDFEIIR